MADGIIGSVGVSVVPDAADFWRRFEAQTRGGATEAGRKSGNAWQRGFQGAAGDTRVRVSANTSQARAQIAALKKETNQSGGAFEKLIKAAITLSPALVPLGAAAAAAGSEFVGLGASGALALKGIKDDLKSATPAGNEVNAMVRTLKGGLSELSQTAADGALPGFEQSVGKLRGELPQLNSVIHDQAQLLGDVTSHLTGGLIGGFQTFAPLLDQVGGSVDRIAADFEAWATGPGGAKFSKVLSQDYAQVAPIIDDIVKSVTHLVEASHGVGLGILTEIGLLARVISAFPTPALEAIVAGFVLFRTVNAGASAVKGVSTALQDLDSKTTKFALRQAAAAAATTASNTQMAASAAASAASVAESQALEAEAAAVAQRQIATALAGTGSILEASAAENAIAAEQTAASYRLAATAAQQSAAQQAAAAEEAALAQRAAAGAAAFSMSSLLGPLGLVAGGLLLLTTSFSGDSQAAQQATQSIQGYTSALVQSNNAVNDAVRAQVAKALSDDGAFDSARKFGITQSELTTAVTQGGPALDALHARLKALGGASADALTPAAKLAGFTGKELKDSVIGLTFNLDQERANFLGAAQAAKDQEAALRGVGNANSAAARAIADGNAAVRAYVDAVDAFNKSADTAADRAKLMGAALVAANGDTLGYANTMVKAAEANQQLVTDFKNLKAGVLDLKTGTIDYHNAAAGPLLNDLQNLQTAAMNAATATYQHELATKGAKQAADDAFSVYKNDTRGALIDEATHLGLTSGQAKKLADNYFNIKNSGDLKKQIELLGGDKVQAALEGILQDLDIMAGKTTVLQVEIQAHNAANVKSGAAKGHGGSYKNFASGTGGGGLPEGWSWVGDPGPQSELLHKSGNRVDVLSHAQSVAMAAQLGTAVPAFASGTGPGGYSGVDYSGKANKYGKTKKSAASSAVYTVGSQQYSSLQAAENAANSLFHAQVTLGLKIDGADISKFQASLKGTADQAHQAFLSMYDDARKLGISDGLSKTLRAENARLDKEIDNRNKAADRLKAVTDQFNQVRSSVSQATSGSFDITSAGTGFDGQQPISLGNIQAQEAQAKNLVIRWAAGIKKLLPTFGKSATGKAMIADLAQRGPSDYPEVQALLTASPKDLTNLIGTQYEINKTGAALGTSVGNTLYGKQIGDLKSQIRIDDRSIDRLASKMEKQLEKAVAKIADRPIEVKVGSTVVATASAAGAKKNARRS